MVKSKFSKLKINKAPGIDLFGTRILIELLEVISEYEAELYNKTLRLEIRKCYAGIQER